MTHPYAQRAQKEIKRAGKRAFLPVYPREFDSCLESEAALEFDHPAGQGTLSPAKVLIRNSRAPSGETEILQVQNVKGIEKIGLYFEIASLAEETRHAKLLCKTQIDVAIFWTAKRIPANRGRKCRHTGYPRRPQRRNGREEPSSSSRKIAARYECVVGTVTTCAAKVGGWTRRTINGLVAGWAVTNYRRPRESAM
jgi:hypothetical protein